MSNSTSRAFYGIPHETGKVGETMSLPTVKDYLKEICKEDNVDVDEYLAKHNEIKTVTDLSKIFKNVYPTHDSSNTNYTLKDKFKSVWLTLSNIKYTAYRPFDFKIYPADSYFHSDSTPWGRFIGFIKFQWSEIKWAWNYKP
jgi:hypothetical protein